ncbi:MAG: hypothetical protein QNJ13_16935 [Paracoccaceae bacterium]|nr:hypothetical protein [Paracoccaceae bacterium]
MKAILLLCATLAFVVGAYVVPFAGFAPEQFPVPQIDPPVQPAGYAFAIWGVIFLWLLASAGYGLIRRAENPGWDALRWPLMVSFIVGASWNTVANQSPVMATILIWVMLAAALWGLLKAPRADRPWLAWPLGLYAGWLTAAASVSLGLLAAGHGVASAVPAAWGAILVAGVLAALVLRATGNLAYGAGLLWALAAVIVRNAGETWSVAVAAGIAMAALLAVAATRRGRLRE